MIDDEEKVLRVIALALAVWSAQAPSVNVFAPLMLAESYFKYMKGENGCPESIPSPTA